jgi:DNA-binding LacI/PurR family transcriptional regulator
MVLGMDGLSATVERVRGYRAGLRAAGLPEDGELIADGGARAGHAGEATGSLLALADTPTAPVSGNNYMRSASCARSRHADCACRTTSRSWRCDPHFECTGHAAITRLTGP